MSEIERVSVHGLKVAKILHDFVVDEVIPGTGIEAAAFWRGLDRIVHHFAPRNRALLAAARRPAGENRRLVSASSAGARLTRRAYKAFLTEIGYLVPEGPAFTVDTANVDAEIAAVAGPQLVVPISNARYALNAANARWGSLYDALYGTDAIPRDGPRRAGQRLRSGARQARHRLGAAFSRRSVPLASGSHADVRGYAVKDGALAATLADGDDRRPGRPQAVSRLSRQRRTRPTAILLVNNGLHIEIRHRPRASDRARRCRRRRRRRARSGADHHHGSGRLDRRGRSRRQGGGLSQLARPVPAARSPRPSRRTASRSTRRLAADRDYTTPDGGALTLPGRSLMLIRNVGHLMTDDGVLDRDGQPAPEGVLDAAITA